jgi:hypothetical protein
VRGDCGCEPGNQTAHLLLGSCVTGNCEGARKTGNVLAEAVTGNESIHIRRRIEAARHVVLASKILARSRQARGYAKRLE